VFGVLGVLTVLASAPWLVIAAFWTGLTVFFTVWIGWPARKLMRGQIPIPESALVANRAAETMVDLLGPGGAPVARASIHTILPLRFVRRRGSVIPVEAKGD
jgi:hypothetical protein